MRSKKFATNPDQPLVTIGVASYNNENYILETLESIANQTYKNLEIIINDDASTDNSVQIIEKWINNHPELNNIFLKSLENEGICKSGNKILKTAKGEYICLIGSDDRYLPEFVEKRVNLLNNTGPEVGFCYSLTYFIDTNGKRIGIEKRPTPSGKIFSKLADGYWSLCKPFTCMYKRECFEEVGYFDETLMYEDFDWFLRATKNFEVIFFDSLDTEYRIRPGSLGHKLISKEGILSTVSIIKKHLNYNKETDKYFRKRLYKLALTSYKQGIKVERSILITSIKHFLGFKEILFFPVTFIPVNWLLSIKKFISQFKIKIK